MNLTNSALRHSERNPVEVSPGLFIRVKAERDECMDPPWENSCGHGSVSEWTRRDKRPGERTLCTDKGFSRFYDYAGAIAMAKRDRWGLSAVHLAELESRLGRKATRGEVCAASVERDFKFLQGWCEDRWEYLCVIVTLEDADGEELGRDCLGGVESCSDYWLECAKEMAETLVESHAKEVAEREHWECRDTVTA